jgi:hypothetical protein
MMWSICAHAAVRKKQTQHTQHSAADLAARKLAEQTVILVKVDELDHPVVQIRHAGIGILGKFGLKSLSSHESIDFLIIMRSDSRTNLRPQSASRTRSKSEIKRAVAEPVP